MNGTALIAGIDLGATKCLVVWLSPAGDVVREERFPSPSDPASLVEKLHALFQETPPVLAGVGIPGFIDKGRTQIIRCPNLPGYADFPLASALEGRTGVPVRLENDANAAALAEARLGAGVGWMDQVYLSLGSGVGGGFIANGALVRGEGFAGEVGHLTIDPRGPACGCGRRGCWELYASGRALAALGGAQRGEQVHEALLAGEPWAEGVLAAYADRVAEGLADVVLMAAPGLVVLGGGVARIGAPLAERVGRSLALRLPSYLSTPGVIPAALGGAAGAIGAALSAR